jgi:hypothetical protein
MGKIAIKSKGNEVKGLSLKVRYKALAMLIGKKAAKEILRGKSERHG